MKRATAPVRPSMRRAAFDPTAEFVAVKDLRISGVEVRAGEGIDKSGIAARRLEQMFEVRQIGYAEGHVEAKPLPRPVAVGPTDLLNPDKCGDPPPKKRAQRVRSRRAA